VVQVDPIKPTMKAPGTQALKLQYHKLLSTFAFKFNLRRYSKVGAIRVEAVRRLAELTTLTVAHLHALAMSLAAGDVEDGYDWPGAEAGAYTRSLLNST